MGISSMNFRRGHHGFTLLGLIASGLLLSPVAQARSCPATTNILASQKQNPQIVVDPQCPTGEKPSSQQLENFG